VIVISLIEYHQYYNNRNRLEIIMGKTFRKDKQYRPKGRGQTFTKDLKTWKKPTRPSNSPPEPPQTIDL